MAADWAGHAVTNIIYVLSCVRQMFVRAIIIAHHEKLISNRHATVAHTPATNADIDG